MYAPVCCLGHSQGDVCIQGLLCQRWGYFVLIGAQGETFYNSVYHLPRCEQTPTAGSYKLLCMD